MKKVELLEEGGVDGEYLELGKGILHQKQVIFIHFFTHLFGIPHKLI